MIVRADGNAASEGGEGHGAEVRKRSGYNCRRLSIHTRHEPRGALCPTPRRMPDWSQDTVGCDRRFTRGWPATDRPADGVHPRTDLMLAYASLASARGGRDHCPHATDVLSTSTNETAAGCEVPLPHDEPRETALYIYPLIWNPGREQFTAGKARIYAERSASVESLIAFCGGPYAAWTNAGRDEMGQRIVRLRAMRDPSRIESEMRELIGEADRLQAWERVAVWAGILPLAGAVGHRFAADLVFQAPGWVLPLVSTPINKTTHFTRGLSESLASAIELAALQPDGEIFPPLLTAAVALVRNLTNPEARHSAMVALAWPCLRWFRRLSACEEAEMFLHDTRDFWPDSDNLPPEPRSNADAFAVILRAVAREPSLGFTGQKERAFTGLEVALSRVTGVTASAIAFATRITAVGIRDRRRTRSSSNRRVAPPHPNPGYVHNGELVLSTPSEVVEGVCEPSMRCGI